MKRVLIVTHLAHASPRIPGMAASLPEFGWQAVVLTPPPAENPESPFSLIEVPSPESLGFWKKLFGIRPGEDVRSGVKQRLGVSRGKSPLDFLITRVGEVVNYPDAEKGWKAPAVSAGSRFLPGEKIDAIISSSSPVTAHIVAGNLAARFKIPWVADLRDLWSQNHNYIYSPLRKALDRRLEKKTLAGADALVTVSTPWAEKLSRLHDDKPTRVITNGFSPEEVNTPPAPLTEKFTITYTGTVYREWQDITRFFAALQGLIAGGAISPAETQVRFYGDRSPWLEWEIERYGLSGVAVQYGRIPYRDALARQRESQLLLLLDWEDPSETGVYPGKVFEYLAAGRPILVTGGVAGNVVDRLMAETGAGTHAVTADDIGKALGEMYRQYRAGGSVPYSGQASEIGKYSYREMAGRFAGVLDTVVREKS